MAFVHAMYQDAGLEIGGGASVGFFEDWARKRGYLTTAPMRGDIICYRFDADNWPDHVGIVTEGVFGRFFKRFGMVRTIEGNTAVGNDDNGGRVMRRTRRISRCRFVRVPGSPFPADKTGTVYHLVERNGIFYTEPVAKVKRKRAA
jgi:cell wall-associated NlpC family hydrolase